MKNKGLIRFFAVILAIISLYQLSFNIVVWRVDKKAEKYAAKFSPEEYVTKLRFFKDSVGNATVYNLGFTKFTYKECKEEAISLGLDLQGGMNVTLEVSLVEFVKALANKNPDPNFNAAVDNAEKIAVTSQRNFVDIFYDEYKKLSPNSKLAALFASPARDINFNSSDEDVIKMIKKEANGAIDRSYDIIRSRIDKFGVTQPNVQKLENQGRILVELPGADDPKRVRELLITTAKLEFWETYPNGDDVYKLLDTISKQLGREMSGEVIPVDTVKRSKEDSLAIAKKDSIAKADTTGKSDEQKYAQAVKESPLLALLQPAADQKTGYQKGAMIGYVKVQDIAKFNEYINTPTAKFWMNNLVNTQGIRFAFGNRELPLKDGGAVKMVYALRVKDVTRGPVMDGGSVASARQDYDQVDGQPNVSMTMTPQGAQAWAAITKANVDKSLAIVLDDAVVSAPNVNGEITGGNSQISGGFTVKEAQDLANILQTGKFRHLVKLSKK